MNLSPPVARALWFTSVYPVLALLLLVVMSLAFLTTPRSSALTLLHSSTSGLAFRADAYLVLPQHFFCISHNAYPSRVQHHAFY